MEHSNAYYVTRGIVRFCVRLLQAAGILGMFWVIIVGLGA